jgi:hypothetical protein
MWLANVNFAVATCLSSILNPTLKSDFIFIHRPARHFGAIDEELLELKLEGTRA